ncbi:MAG: hypothetical protein M3441_20815 [Chloroflexota bacterium]|nr:hypothetical protein [Chloroflexota bacterium]
MTYLVALHLSNFNAIIADERASFEGGGSNDRVKTGILFPGCIYGRLGNEYESARFIRAFASSLESTAFTQASEAWEHLGEFAQNFSYFEGSDHYFALLLSSRISGAPQFYLLEPHNGIVPFGGKNPGLSTFGSGKRLLDDYVAGASGLPFPLGMSFMERIEKSIDQMLADGLPPSTVAYTTPYMLCLWLTELTINYERDSLEAEGVGGVFHFLFQRPDTEAAPHPGVYIFTRPDVSGDRPALYVAWFRVAHAGNGLYVERFISAGFDSDTPADVKEKRIVLDVVSRPDLEDDYDREELYREIDDELNAQPYAYFVGIGQYRPDHRARVTFFYQLEEVLAKS